MRPKKPNWRTIAWDKGRQSTTWVKGNPMLPLEHCRFENLRKSLQLSLPLSGKKGNLNSGALRSLLLLRHLYVASDYFHAISFVRAGRYVTLRNKPRTRKAQKCLQEEPLIFKKLLVCWRVLYFIVIGQETFSHGAEKFNMVSHSNVSKSVGISVPKKQMFVGTSAKIIKNSLAAESSIKN